MNVGLVGDGPAIEAVEAAFEDVEARVAAVAPGDLGSVDLGVVVAPTGSDAFEHATDAATHWIAVEVGGVGGHPIPELDAAVSVYGPDSACYRCLRTRVGSNLASSSGRPRGDRSAVRFAGAVAGRRAVRTLAGEDLAGTVVEVPGPERTFLPVPGCDCGEARDRTLDVAYRDVSLEDALSRAELAIDERVGLVTQVGERESFPLPYYLAQTADTTGFSDARAAEFAAGTDPDWDRAFVKALGEALERYSAGVYRSSEFTVAPVESMANAVPPGEFVLPDSSRDPDPGEAIPWVPGTRLDDAGDVSLPAEFVHFPPPEPRHKPPITTGLGLGNSTVEALLSGLYEVVERDATMLAWYSSFDPLALSVEDEQFRTLAGRARAEDLAVSTWLVTQDVDVPVVAVAVHRDGDWPRFAMGSDADLDAIAAARAALAEALQNWMELRAMGADQARDEEGEIGRYAALPDTVQEFVGDDGGVPASSVGSEPVSGEAELEAVVDAVRDAGLDAYAARLTTRDVGQLGFEAVRVLVPSAQPLFTGEPFFGERAQSVPASMGFEPRLDREYHPYP